MVEEVMGIFPEFSGKVDEGRMMDAWKLAQATGVPLERWPEGEPLRQAARLAGALGANRLNRVLHWKNWRGDKEDPARYYQSLFSRVRGATGFRYLSEIDGFISRHPEMTAPQRADLLAFQGSILSSHRDFEPAFRKFREALELYPDDSWLHAEHARALSAADRYEEALEVSEKAVALSPVYRAAVLIRAETLVHLGRDDEALELVSAAHRESPQGSFAVMLQLYHSERGEPEKALLYLDDYEACSPLMEDSSKAWLAGRRADFLMMSGDLDGFEAFAEKAGKGFHSKALERLDRAGKRVMLPVPFVRQHRSTCGPATLAAISSYWGKNHDHLEIADAICHDGTPWHKERRWAEENGFVTREFRLTRESLTVLIDRGIPFTLTTQWATGGHLQACVGYDTRIDLAVLRDPTQRHFGEMAMEGLIASHPIGGPRALVLIPEEKAELLDGLTFDEELVYDASHHLRTMMDTHDRLKIDAAVVGLRSVAPGHPITIEGEMRVAQAREEWPRALAFAEELLARFPDNETLWLTKANLLSNLRRSGECRKWLESIVGREKRTDPVFLSELGEMLLEDARELNRGEGFLWRALLRQWPDGRLLENYARCRVKQRRYDDAAVLRRASSCLAPAFEPYALNYFEMCRITGDVASGLAFLEERTRSHGAKDHGPWITHAKALDLVNRSSEAAAVIEKAISLRPGDGMLALHGGRLMVAWGPDFREKGMALIESSRGRVPETTWLWNRASVTGYSGERTAVIRYLRKLIEIQSDHGDAWRQLARAIAEEDGTDEAIAMLRDAVKKHPSNDLLWSLLAEWLVSSKDGAIPALDRYLELSPRSIWGYRERALRYYNADDFVKALADAKEAMALDPLDPVSIHIHGVILRKAGRPDDAAGEFRKALSIDIDHEGAMAALMEIRSERERALEELAFIEGEMIRQVSCGPAVLNFQSAAWRWLEPDVLLGKLKDFCRMRPDLWQTWSARINQALKMGLTEEAEIAALAEKERFPLMPRTWVDVASVHRAKGEFRQETDATARALELSPGWDEAAREHADALERQGRAEEAEKVLRKALEMDPLNAANLGYCADLVRRRGRHGEAFGLLVSGLKDFPFYEWAWTTLGRWATQDGRVPEVVSELEKGSLSHGHRHRWWITAAGAWGALGDQDKAIESLRAGLAMKPEDVDLRDHLSWRLAGAGRFEEAIEVCSPASDGKPPKVLAGRRAWVKMAQGYPVQAIAEMRALLEEEPDYEWALAELTTWLAERYEWQKAFETASKWARLAPHDARAFARKGEASQALGKDADAEMAYLRAFDLQPNFQFAGRQLLDLQMKARKFDEAEETLKRLRYFVPSVWIDCDGIELSLHRGNAADALQRAEGLLAMDEAHFGVLKWVDEIFTKHGRENAWRELVGHCLKDGRASAPGALAISLSHLPAPSLKTTGYKRVIKAAAGPARISAWRLLIERTGERKEDVLSKWATKHREELSGEASLWREIGGAYLSLGDCLRGWGWMAEWRQREKDLTPQALVWISALADACRSKYPQAKIDSIDARKELLRRFPEDDSAPAMRGALAWHLAHTGNIGDAKALLAEFEEERAADYYANYGKLARAMVSATEGDEVNARLRLAEATKYFAEFSGGAKILVTDSCRFIASRLPWAKGSERKLRKAWHLGAAPSQPMFEGLEGKPWMITIVVIVVINFLRACSDQ